MYSSTALWFFFLWKHKKLWWPWGSKHSKIKKKKKRKKKKNIHKTQWLFRLQEKVRQRFSSVIGRNPSSRQQFNVISCFYCLLLSAAASQRRWESQGAYFKPKAFVRCDFYISACENRLHVKVGEATGSWRIGQPRFNNFIPCTACRQLPSIQLIQIWFRPLHDLKYFVFLKCCSVL